MSNLLNFIDTGFIIILSILLVISGGIMFYCYRRLNLLEDSIINQGKILQNLILNLQNNKLFDENNELVHENNKLVDENNELVDENNELLDKNKKNEKIYVSDLEDSEISDTDNSSESDNISDINDDILGIVKDDLNIKTNDLDKNNNELNIQEITDNASTKVLELTDDVLDEITDTQFISNINNYDASKNDTKKYINKIKGLSKMKIDDIKQLII